MGEDPLRKINFSLHGNSSSTVFVIFFKLLLKALFRTLVLRFPNVTDHCQNIHVEDKKVTLVLLDFTI